MERIVTTVSKFLSVAGARIKALRLHKEMTQNDPALPCYFETANLPAIKAGNTNITVPAPRKMPNALDAGITELSKNNGGSMIN